MKSCCCHHQPARLPHTGDADRGASRRAGIACSIGLPLFGLAIGGGLGWTAVWAVAAIVIAGWLISKS